MDAFRELFGTGNMLRSAEMEYVSLIVQEHLAHDTVEKLGEVGSVQFTDLNGDLTAFKRFYTPAIRRCDEVEKKLRFFEEEMKKHGLSPEGVSTGEFSVWKTGQADMVAREHRGMTLLDYWEAVVNERHKDYFSVKQERDKTAATLYQAVQRRYVIERASQFFVLERGGSAAAAAAAARGPATLGGAGAGSSRANAAAALEAGRARDEVEDMQFKHVAGIIATADKVNFSRIVFRASSGHAVVRFSDIENELLDDKGTAQEKSVFCIFYRGRSLASKLDRICTAFGAHQHDIPNFSAEAEVAAALEEAKSVISDSVAWLEQEKQTTVTALQHLAVIVRKWRMGVQREKAVYHSLNMFLRNPERGSISAQGWVLKTSVAAVREAIKTVHTAAAQGGRPQPFYFEVLSGPSLPTAPTHFHVNKFTRVFQAIVNTYGVPRYREANPALWSIMTFPFLFGVMFGDMGHATFLTLFATWIVYNEQSLGSRKLNEIFAMCFKGRYMLLLMGIFSIYCGAIYNDVFSLGTAPMHSSWRYAPTNSTGPQVATWDNTAEAVYPFGIDPEWHNSENDLLFFNSLKMKMSVVLGITQMIFGLILKTANAIYFKSKVDLWFECIPQLVFMVGLFGYMIFLIFLKWWIDWNDPATRPGAPPSLIDTLINIVLKPGTVNDAMYEGQAGFQTVLLLVVFACVPVMLVAKPYLLHKAHKEKKSEDRHHLLNEGNSSSSGAADASQVQVSAGAGTGISGEHHEEAHGAAHGGGGGHGGHEEHGFGELFIHQAIETIEFVLGSVSNTASYLRLWALSLAHSQLATVFWERALVATIEMNSAVYVVVGWAVFAAITFGVLLVMDVLECFLHALRLHWVEFQNKFYKADGYKFTPFSFEALAEAAAAED